MRSARKLHERVSGRSSASIDETESVTFLSAAQTGWSYRKGTSEASTPVDEWRKIDFVEDASWLLGQTPVGYGDNDAALGSAVKLGENEPLDGDGLGEDPGLG